METYQRPYSLIITIIILHWLQTIGNCFEVSRTNFVTEPNPTTTTKLNVIHGIKNGYVLVSKTSNPKSTKPSMIETRNLNNLQQQQQDVPQTCSFNTMCQCTGYPNNTLFIEIVCNNVKLYKFPEFIHNSVRYIEMSNSHLQSVDHDTFQGLRLKSLKLNNNELQYLSEKSFSTMSHSLLSLDLTGNKLLNIPFKALHKLHVLTRLVIQKNYITSLDGNWQAQFDTLRSLHISDNEISEISFYQQHTDNSNYNTSDNFFNLIKSKSNVDNQLPGNNNLMAKSTFNKLRKLLWLDLSNNRIYQLIANNMPRSLVTLDLANNILTTFPTQIFEQLIQLRILSLRNNLIKNLQPNKDFRLIHINLEKLDLGENQLESIERDWFQSNMLDIRVRALNLEQNYISELTEATFKGTNIIHLVLAYNNLYNIHKNAFDGLSESLEYLDLEHNQLNIIPYAISTLNKLKYLYLAANNLEKLTNLPTNTENLRVLSLSGNNFNTIPILQLKNYANLTYLNMGYNYITDIPTGIFAFESWATNLQTILLRNNKITHLHMGSFNGLSQIQEISLSFNDINIHQPLIFENISHTLKILELSFAVFPARIVDSIDPLDILQPLTQLIWLGIDNNNLKTISNTSLINMRELGYINLSFNQLKCLPRGLFQAEVHVHLVEIDLSYNMLQKLTPYTFYGLTDLQTINLQSNKLKIIDKHAFDKLQYLQSIDLSYNKLEHLAINAFSFLPNLNELNLAFNNLMKFSLKSLYLVTNSTTIYHLKLNLSHNKLHIFEDDFKENYEIYIKNLDLSYNYLNKTNNFNNLALALKALNLAHNHINYLNNNAFGKLELLESLNLAFNNISYMRRRSFLGLNNLQILDLSYNNLEQLQVEQFSNLYKLRILYLQNNRLRVLSREVFMNTRLEYLDITANQLNIWPVLAFTDVGFTLRSVQISKNYIEYLDAGMFINTQFLFNINLASNNLAVLPDNTFMFLNNLTQLDLSSNPLITTNLKQVLLHCQNLRSLKLANISLNNWPIVSLPFLTDLDISTNNLTETYKLQQLRQLRYLNISHNKITNASCVLEYLPQSLKKLDISYNNIRRLTTHDLTNLRHLIELYMLDIKVQNPVAFNKLRVLRKLQLTAYNNLIDILTRLPALNELHINHIDKVLGPIFSQKSIKSTKIEKLYITGLNLKSIAEHAFETFAFSTKLYLKISHTMITDLPPAVFYALRNVPDLTIDLSHNQINALAADSFYPNKTYWDSVGTRAIIGGIDTHNNPLECECGLIWFGHWLRRWLRETAQIKVIQKNYMQQMIQRARSNTCFDVISQQTLPIIEIFPEDLLCQASALSNSTPSLYKIVILFLTILLQVLIFIL